jgi:site-specific recombinase XerD
MFKTLYRCARTAARHENGPAAQSRLKYLEYLAEGGSGLHSLRANAGVIYRSAVCMDLDDTSLVERLAIEKTAKDWAHRRYRNAMAVGPEQTEKEFRFITCAWLRHAGRLRESDIPAVPYAKELDAYCRYMTAERGLATATVVSSRWHLINFLKYVGDRPLKQLRSADVDQFLASLGMKGWTRNGIRSIAHVLRGFFKYGETQKWTKPGISGEIHGPRIYRHESLPLGPTWPDVQRLLASTETDRSYDIRDRPILLLMAVYGMRVGEVRRIRLEDMDSDKGTLTIPLTKQRRARICPMIPSLAEAIERYLREVRPKSSYPELFLRLNAPHRPFRPGGLYGIVAYRMKRLNIEAPRIGPHSLRHACATHLLAQGLTLREVGSHLGHSTEEATLAYAKVDMPMLREVAELDLGGLL